MNTIIDLTQKVGLVTGAGGGIGRSVAITMAQAGALLVVSDIDVATGQETAEIINASGGQARFVRCDVTQAGSVHSLVDMVVNIYGRLDMAHNNAGADGQFAPIIDADEAEFDRLIAVNLKSVWLCMRAELRQMVTQGSGAIVNTASVVGLTASPNIAGYGAAKHGVLGLTKTAAVEYAATGIRVNAICPGLTRTQMTDRIAASIPGFAEAVRATPIARMGEPREMATMVTFLLSDAASYMTGQHVTIDGGYTAA